MYYYYIYFTTHKYASLCLMSLSDKETYIVWKYAIKFELNWETVHIMIINFMTLKVNPCYIFYLLTQTLSYPFTNTNSLKTRQVYRWDVTYKHYRKYHHIRFVSFSLINLSINFGQIVLFALNILKQLIIKWWNNKMQQWAVPSFSCQWLVVIGEHSPILRCHKAIRWNLPRPCQSSHSRAGDEEHNHIYWLFTVCVESKEYFVSGAY